MTIILPQLFFTTALNFIVYIKPQTTPTFKPDHLNFGGATSGIVSISMVQHSFLMYMLPLSKEQISLLHIT